MSSIIDASPQAQWRCCRACFRRRGACAVGPARVVYSNRDKNYESVLVVLNRHKEKRYNSIFSTFSRNNHVSSFSRITPGKPT